MANTIEGIARRILAFRATRRALLAAPLSVLACERPKAVDTVIDAVRNSAKAIGGMREENLRRLTPTVDNRLKTIGPPDNQLPVFTATAVPKPSPTVGSRFGDIQKTPVPDTRQVVTSTPDAQATTIADLKAENEKLRAAAAAKEPTVLPASPASPTPTALRRPDPTATAKPEPTFAPTAAPAKPTAAPIQPTAVVARTATPERRIAEAEELEPVSGIVLVPTYVAEAKTFDFKDGTFQGKYPKEQRIAKPGWNYVYAEFAVDNKKPTPQLIMLDSINLEEGAVLHTHDGFTYKPEKPPKTSAYFGHRVGGFGGALGGSVRTVYQTLPPGFRALGAVIDRGAVTRFPDLWYPNNTTAFVNRVAFLAGEQTSGFKLKITPQLKPYEDRRLFKPAPFSEIDLGKATDLKSLRFPTSRPDSEFKNLGTPVNAPGKGSMTIEKALERKDWPYRRYYGDDSTVKGAASRVRMSVNFRNENKGYAKKFNVVMMLFGDDGMIYTNATEEAVVAFPEQPQYWGGFFLSSKDIGPGQSQTLQADLFTSLTVKRGKLVVAGDINEIFNIELPDAT